MRYGFPARAEPATGDLRWVVTGANKRHVVVSEKIDVFRFVLPAPLGDGGRGYVYSNNSEMKASRETPMGRLTRRKTP